MSIQFKLEPKEGECSVVGCTRSKANKDRIVLHHEYETNAQEKEKYKGRVKTPVSRLKPSEKEETQKRNQEERNMCTWVCIPHHSELHSGLSQQLAATAAASLTERVEQGMQLVYVRAEQPSAEEIERVRKRLRRRLKEMERF